MLRENRNVLKPIILTALQKLFGKAFLRLPITNNEISTYVYYAKLKEVILPI